MCVWVREREREKERERERKREGGREGTRMPLDSPHAAAGRRLRHGGPGPAGVDDSDRLIIAPGCHAERPGHVALFPTRRKRVSE